MARISLGRDESRIWVTVKADDDAPESLAQMELLAVDAFRDMNAIVWGLDDDEELPEVDAALTEFGLADEPGSD